MSRNLNQDNNDMTGTAKNTNTVTNTKFTDDNKNKTRQQTSQQPK